MSNLKLELILIEYGNRLLQLASSQENPTLGELIETPRDAIKQLMADEFEKLIGEDEPVDMSFSRTEDQIIRDTCYTQGVNETKAEQRQKLKEWKK